MVIISVLGLVITLLFLTIVGFFGALFTNAQMSIQPPQHCHHPISQPASQWEQLIILILPTTIMIMTTQLVL